MAGIEHISTFFENNSHDVTVSTGDLVKYLHDMEGLTVEQKNNIYDYIGHLSKQGITPEEHNAILEAINYYKTGIIRETQNNISDLREELFIDQNYFEYLEEEGFSEDIKEMILYYCEKLGLDTSNEEKLFEGFEFLVKLFADIESDGMNIVNNGDSSAKGYFQFLTGNGRLGYEVMINGVYQNITEDEYNTLLSSGEKEYNGEEFTKLNIRYKRSSYELALRRLKWYFGDNEPEWLKSIDIDRDGRTEHNPMMLTPEQQTMLFLISIFASRKTVMNRNGDLVGIKDFLDLAINGNEWGVKKIYYVFHHTDPDDATKIRIRRLINKYRSNLIALR